jgi:hypothetical protein
MNINLVFLFAGIVILAALVLFLMTIGKRKRTILDVDKYRAKCLEIEHQLKDGDVASYHMSVLNADKLVDQAMREKGTKGDTMGDRLRSAATLFSDRNGLWLAHKLRNRIAHESNVTVTYVEAKSALGCFRKALKDLGAI